MSLRKNQFKYPPFLIAEIGINHNGSLKLAKKLIDLSVKYNFNAVKFQKRNPDVSTPGYQKEIIRDTPWGQMTYLNYKKKIEFGLKEFKEIDKYCKKKKFLGLLHLGILKAANFYLNLNVNIIKLHLQC